MASKGGVGIRLDMDAVPCRESGMTPYEMMLSESQERMLMVLKPGREAAAEAIFRKWELDFAVIGTITNTERMELIWQGETIADIPLGPLADEAPLYDRPHVPTPARAPLGPISSDSDIGDDLVRLMGSPDLATRRSSASTTAPRASRSRPTARRAIASPIRSRVAARRSPNAGAT
jgi:phosphoribosylformylglycinamidine synthase